MLLVGNFDDIQQSIDDSGHSLSRHHTNPIEMLLAQVGSVADLLQDVAALQEAEGGVLLELQHFQG